MHTNSNQKLVLSAIPFKWKYSISVKGSGCHNYELLYDTEKRTQYNNKIAKQLSQQQLPTNTQERWTNISNATTKAAHKIVLLKRNKRSYKQRN